MMLRVNLCLILFGLSAFPLQLRADNSDSYEKYWEGMYISGQFGAGWNRSHLEFQNGNYYNTLGAVTVGTKFQFHPLDFVGGGALGYHYQIDDFVFGIELGALDLGLDKENPSPYFPNLDTFYHEIDWLSFAKAHVGFAYKRLLTYLTGGWAGSSTDLKLDDFVSNIVARSSKWVNGWTLGVGIDWKVFYYFSLGLEYDYIRQRYNNSTVRCPSCGTGVGFGTPIVDNRMETQLLLVRMNFYFW